MGAGLGREGSICDARGLVTSACPPWRVSQENVEMAAPAAHLWLQGATIGEVAGLREGIMTTRLMAIPKRAGWLRGETIKCWWNKELVFWFLST